jgi:hypothetical protein
MLQILAFFVFVVIVDGTSRKSQVPDAPRDTP